MRAGRSAIKSHCSATVQRCIHNPSVVSERIQLWPRAAVSRVFCPSARHWSRRDDLSRRPWSLEVVRDAARLDTSLFAKKKSRKPARNNPAWFAGRDVRSIAQHGGIMETHCLQMAHFAERIPARICERWLLMKSDFTYDFTRTGNRECLAESR